MTDASQVHVSDLLYGVKAIAPYLQMTNKQVYHLHDKGELPTFKVGATVCARRSTLATYFAAQEANARAAL